MKRKFFTKKRKQVLKKIFIFLAIVLLALLGGYHFGKNDNFIEKAKEELGIKMLEEEISTQPSPYKGDEVEQKEDENDLEKKDILSSNLPEDAKYGSPVSIGKNKVTYSDLKGLEIEILNQKNENISCSEVTEILKEKINTWFYWNTCRTVLNNDESKGISFFVIKLSEDKEYYIYEKHYMLKGFYSKYELESSINADTNNISDDIQVQNNELKTKNKDYKILEIVDSLFEDIIKQ